MTKRTKTQLDGDVTTNFPDNTTGAITAQVQRTHLTDMQDSLPFLGTQTAGRLTYLDTDGNTLADASITEGATDLEMLKQILCLPAGVTLGNTFQLSGVVDTLAFKGSDGRTYLVEATEYTTAGTQTPVSYVAGTEQNFVIGDVFNATLSDPFSFTYTTTLDSLVTDFTIRPATSGTLTAKVYIGTDATGALIQQADLVVQSGDVDKELSFGMFNPAILSTGTSVHTVFSGLQLQGGTATTGPMSGQTVPFLTAKIQTYTTRTPIFDTTNTALGTSLDTSDFDVNLDDTVTNVQLLASRVDELPLSRAALSSVEITGDTTINSGNVATFNNKFIRYTGTTDQNVTVTLPADDVTTTYPIILTFAHEGGVTRDASTNGLTITALSGDRIRSPNGSFQSLTLTLGETISIRLDSANSGGDLSASWFVTEQSLEDQIISALPDGTVQIRPETLDLTSDNTFLRSLPNAVSKGFAYRVRVGGTFPTTSVTINVDDLMIAAVDTPSLSTIDNWIIIRDTALRSITTAEFNFLERLNQIDARVDVSGAFPDAARFVRFWLRTAIVLPANINNSGNGLRIDESNGDLADDADAFEDDVTSNDTILYVAFDDNVFDVDNVEVSDIDIIVTGTDGLEVQRLNLSTDFVHQTDLDAVVAGTSYFRTSGALGGQILRYNAGQRITAVRTTTNRHFTLDTPDVDVTQNVTDLPEAQLAPEVREKLNNDTIPEPEQDFLNQITRTTSDSSDAALPTATAILWKFGNASADSSDYYSTTADTGIFGSFDGPVDVVVAIADNIRVTGWTATVSGTATTAEITPSLLDDHRMWRVTIPTETNASNRYKPNGIVTTTSEFDVSSLVKMGEENLDDELIADLNRAHNTDLTEPMRDLQNHLRFTQIPQASWFNSPNPTDHPASSIGRQFAAYWDENRRGSTPFTGNYFDDQADPTITLTGGVNASGGALNNDANKIIAFSHYIANENFTTDVPLLKAGTRRILGIGPNGLHVRVGNQDGASTTVSLQTRLFNVAGDRSIQYLTGTGATSVSYFVPDTITFPETFTIRFKTVEANGSVGPQTELEYTITDRAVSQAQNSQTVAISLPTPPGGTRDETITTEYNATNNTLIVGTTGLSQNTSQDVTHLGMEVTFDDDATVNTSTTNTDAAFHQQDEHRGRTVDILLLIRAANPNETSADKFLEILAIVNGYQENTINLHWRESNFDFSDLQFGPNTAFTNYFFSDDDKDDTSINPLFPGKQSFASDGDVSIANIQVYSVDDGGNPFNSPTHANLYDFWVRRNEWLGLFIHPDDAYGFYTMTARGLILQDAVTSPEEFDIITRFKSLNILAVHQATDTTAAQLETSVTLPVNYDTYDFLRVTEFVSGTPNEWRTVTIDIPLLTGGDVGLTDHIRQQGNTDLTWNSATRVIAQAQSTDTLYRVALHRTETVNS